MASSSRAATEPPVSIASRPTSSSPSPVSSSWQPSLPSPSLADLAGRDAPALARPNPALSSRPMRSAGLAPRRGTARRGPSPRAAGRRPAETESAGRSLAPEETAAAAGTLTRPGPAVDQRARVAAAVVVDTRMTFNRCCWKTATRDLFCVASLLIVRTRNGNGQSLRSTAGVASIFWSCTLLQQFKDILHTAFTC